MKLIPMDDRDGFIWLDGKLIPWRDAKIHILTHGLHYASSVFEGERCYNGEIFKLTEHSQRLIRSAEIIGFKIPYSVAQIDAATKQVVAAQQLKDCYVRPIAWRGSEMLGVSAPQSTVHLAIAVWVWASYFTPETKAKGVRLTLAAWRRPAPDTAPTASKAAGLYMICTHSKEAAEAQGFADALMLDYRGLVAEATGANVFFNFNGELHTPTPDCFLDGITRKTVMDLARKRGIKVVERAIHPREIGKAQEMFLTGTAAEITPVAELVMEPTTHQFQVGNLTRMMMDDYSRLVRQQPLLSSVSAA
ncbi:MAG TPA: branched-chain amino acid aminotransferase [Alphaproteobacteria bacterium]|nr:branched-chain amino acid aminotransferase [Alphaproteobacteria bacterium]